MVRYNKYGSRIFLAPEAGGGSGTGNSSANQAGAKEQDGSTIEINPFDKMDFDNFDPATRKEMEVARDAFTTLQKGKAEAELGRQKEEQQRKQFQSQYDQTQAQLQKLNGQQQQIDPKQAQLAKFKEILGKRGVPPEQQQVQAELMLELMGEFGATLKEQIGRDVLPFAQSVVSREAEFAWNTAIQSDSIGAMSIPEVVKVAEAQVIAMAGQGQQVTAKVVENLVAMAYMDHLRNGGAPAGQQQQQQQQQQVSLPSFGRTTFNGGGANTKLPQRVDPNAPRHSLDPDTDAALQTVLGVWAKNGQKTSQYREPAKFGGRK